MLHHFLGIFGLWVFAHKAPSGWNTLPGMSPVLPPPGTPPHPPGFSSALTESCHFQTLLQELGCDLSPPWLSRARLQLCGPEPSRGPACWPEDGPGVEVLHVDVLVRGRLSLAPEEEPLLGRGLCRTHEDSEPRLTAKGTAPRAGGSPLGLRHKRQREAGGRGPWTGQPQCGCPFWILAARQAPEAVTHLGSPWK